MKKQTFKNLIFLAQQEPFPKVNVAENVMHRLASISTIRVDPYRAYAWIGSISGALAACILIAVSLFRQASSDPINEIMTYVSWIAQ